MAFSRQFAERPREGEPSRQFRNVCREFKKAIQTTKDIDVLQTQIEHFVNANKKVRWPHETSAVFRKDTAEKAVTKVVTEFQRYLKDVIADPSQANPQDLLDSISIVESMIDLLKGHHS